MRTLARAITGAVAVVVIGSLAAPPGLASTDTEPPAPFDIVADVGEFQDGYVVTAPWNSIYITWFITSDNVGPISYELAVGGEVQRVVPQEDSYVQMTKRIEVPEGQFEVTVTAVDASGNRRPANQFLDVTVDKTDPSFDVDPTLSLRRGLATATDVPMRFDWSVSDIGTGLDYVRVGYGTTCCVDLDPSVQTYAFGLPLRSVKQWRVFAYDRVGRVAKRARNTYVRPAKASELRAIGDWRRRTLSGGFDGDELVSRTKGDRLVFRVRALSVSWVATQGPGRGIADIYVDGVRSATIDLRSAHQRSSHAVWSTALSPGRGHRIEIVNRSPAARPLVGSETLLVHGSS